MAMYWNACFSGTRCHQKCHRFGSSCLAAGRSIPDRNLESSKASRHRDCSMLLALVTARRTVCGFLHRRNASWGHMHRYVAPDRQKGDAILKFPLPRRAPRPRLVAADVVAARNTLSSQHASEYAVSMILLSDAVSVGLSFTRRRSLPGAL
jgi:hypothetical protein